MYKRVLITSSLLVLIASPFVSAEEASPSINLTPDELTTISTNCVSTQTTLTRIFSNDVLSRVHLGGEFETISSKYMAPMNSRIALNKLDGVTLTKTTVDFNDKLRQFRERYQTYKETMSHVTQMNCASNPADFFDAVEKARTDRAAVHDSVVSLESLAKQYRTQVSDLRARTLALKRSVK